MKNIEINYMNEGGYEVLYPKTNLESIEGFQEFREGIYSKEEVDGIIELLREQTGNLKFTMGSYKGTEELWGDQKTGVWMQIELGFTPEYFVVSEEQKNYAYYPYFLGQNSNLGFGPYFYVAKKPALQPTSTGFQVRNTYGELSSGYGYRLDLNKLNVTYYYLAFG